MIGYVTCSEESKELFCIEETTMWSHNRVCSRITGFCRCTSDLYVKHTIIISVILKCETVGLFCVAVCLGFLHCDAVGLTACA
jgi:hypothetical protein